MLADDSWDLGSLLLGPDSIHGDLHLDPSQAEPTFDAFHYAENHIEAWAAQYLPSDEGLLVPLELSSNSPAAGYSLSGASREHCYGMVCHTGLPRAFPLPTSVGLRLQY